MGLAGAAAAVGATAAVANTAHSFMGAGAASKAAGQQSAAIQQGVDFQNQVYDQAGQLQQPFYQTGVNALGSVNQLYGLAPPPGSTVPQGNALDAYAAYTKTPFYQFPLQQGQAAIERSGAARGLTLSGGQFNAIQQYGQGAAASNFDKYIAGLTSLANLGPTAAGAVTQAGLGVSGNVLQGQKGIGASNAAGTVGAANQYGNALNSVGPLAQSVAGLWGKDGPFGSNSTSYGPGNDTPDNAINTAATNPAEQAYVDAQAAGTPYTYTGT